MGEKVTMLWVALDLLFFVPVPLKRLHRPRKHIPFLFLFCSERMEFLRLRDALKGRFFTKYSSEPV
jgi:hypothetical protein